MKHNSDDGNIQDKASLNGAAEQHEFRLVCTGFQYVVFLLR